MVNIKLNTESYFLYIQFLKVLSFFICIIKNCYFLLLIQAILIETKFLIVIQVLNTNNVIIDFYGSLQ